MGTAAALGARETVCHLRPICLQWGCWLHGMGYQLAGANCCMSACGVGLYSFRAFCPLWRGASLVSPDCACVGLGLISLFADLTEESNVTL